MSGRPAEAVPAVGPPRWLGALGILVSVVAVVGVVIWALGQPAPELPSGAPELGALLASALGVGWSSWLRAERWRRLVFESGGSIGHADCYGIFVVGVMGNTVLPARGGDGLRVLLARSRAGLPVREGIGTLLAERLLDVTVLLGTFAVLAWVVLRGIDTPDTLPLALLGCALLAGVLTLLVLWRLRDRHEWADRLIRFIAPMSRATRRLAGRHGVLMLAITVTIWLSEAAIWLGVSYATGLDLDPIDAVYLVALAAVFVLVPAGPGYAGTLDAGIIFGVRALGGSGSAALSFLVVLRVVLFVPITIAGLLLLIFRYGGTGLLREAERPA